MDAAAMTRYIIDTFADVETTSAYGYTFFFYRQERKLPFATMISEDNEYDRVSNLDRPEVFRLNIGVGRDTYRAVFGPPPAAGADGVVATGHDFSALDQLMPHPVYAAQSWVCILSPSDATLQHTVRPLLSEAYDIAVKRYRKAHPRDES